MSVKALKSTARRGGVICATALAALSMAACSAGQITQTSSQVAAVDGASADSEDGALALREVTVKVDENGQTGLKFVAVNQDYAQNAHTVQSAEVDGHRVNFDRNLGPVDFGCSLIADTAAGHEQALQDKNAGCVDYVEASVPGEFAIGGNVPVKVTFDTGEIEVVAPVTGEQIPAGEFTRGTGNPADEHR